MISQDKWQSRLEGTALLSVDLFDTLVTRGFAHPADLFYALQEKLAGDPECEKIDSFAEARISSEYRLREEAGFKKEVTLDEIYNRWRVDFGLPQALTDRVRAMEMELEEQNILPIKPMADVLKGVKEILKVKVILISDTYLPRGFVANILERHRLAGLFDRLYVSSAQGVLKSTGDLFRLVKKEENMPVKKWLHIGDNAVSDHEIPGKMGIKTYRFTDACLTRYEKSFAPHPAPRTGPRPGHTGSPSTFAALLRQARLECPYKKENEKIIWDTTIDVSAPLMIAYVSWCLEKAQAWDTNRIYFMARDGQILAEIAAILNRPASPLEIRYLYVSRQALLFPAMQGVDDESLNWILTPTSLLTPRIILKRLNIVPGEIASLLEKYGFQNVDKKMSRAELPAFASLLRDRDIRLLVEERTQEYRANTLGYLEQEGVTKEGRFALIDIGWNGTLQRSISRLLETTNKTFPVKGLYFGLRRVLKHKDSDKLETFFFSPGKSRGLEKESHIIPIIELFSAADHGGVLKYEFKDTRYQPVLRDGENSRGVRWGVKVQHRAMTCLAERIAGISLDELLPGIDQNLRQFVRAPSLREAKVYGSYLDAEDQNESYYSPLARKYNLFELYCHYKHGYRHHHNEWVEGARRLSRGLCGRYLWHRWSTKNDVS